MYPSLKVSQPHQFPQPRRYFLKDSLLCHDVWLQGKTYLPSMAIRNLPLARSNSEALLLENPMNWGFTWGVWLLASGVFSCVLWHRVHKSIHDYFNVRQMSNVLKKLKALVTLLTYPVPTCTAERSFSSINRLKSPLRSTMMDERLSFPAILHIHKHKNGHIDSYFRNCSLQKTLKKWLK